MPFLILFVAVSLIHLISIATSWSEGAMYSKPFLMPTLALWVMTLTRGSRGRWAWLTALVFSTAGDIFLMQTCSACFLLGLGSFLMAHLAYIVGARSLLSGRRGYVQERPYWIIIFGLFPVGLLFLLWSGIPADLRLPVGVYAAVITLMALGVLQLRGRLTDRAFWPLMIGALLFMASDSMIAVNKFGYPFGAERIAIMTTYILGQFLLAVGLTRSQDAA